MKNDKLIQKLNNFKSIREMLKVFPNEKKCEKFLKEVRWGEEVKSPYDEFVFRYNTRDYDVSERFVTLLSNMTVRTRYNDLKAA